MGCIYYLSYLCLQFFGNYLHDFLTGLLRAFCCSGLIYFADMLSASIHVLPGICHTGCISYSLIHYARNKECLLSLFLLY